MSSTSFTEDENFMVMIEGLDYVQTLITKHKLPNIRVVVTGKGPQKAEYEKLFEERNRDAWENIHVSTAWLEADDYPKFVGACDLGVCFHTSSSGLDLPMKVVDMFAATLPAFAINYEAIGELVLDKQNGRLFTDRNDLSQLIFEILKEGPNSPTLAKYRKHLSTGFAKERWESHWNRIILNLMD
jgi:beta-1,4-mannosyltransferase